MRRVFTRARARSARTMTSTGRKSAATCRADAPYPLAQMRCVVQRTYQCGAVGEPCGIAESGDVEMHPEHGGWRSKQRTADEGLDRRHVTHDDDRLTLPVG